MSEPESQVMILINVFEVPEGQEEEFIRGWEASRDYLQQQPGYLDTALHQAVSPDADFRFINVGRWQTAEAFGNATQSAGFREVMGRMGSFHPHPALYRIVRT